MSAWKDSDEVTTTYGSIQLSLEQAHAAGIKTEQERIIKLLNQLIEQRPADWTHAKGFWFEDVIALIKGETNE